LSATGSAKGKVGRPPNPVPAPKAALWESEVIATQLQNILDALEVPPIDAETRGIFQRMLYRQKYFGGDVRGRIVFIIRCITESSGNENALIGPVVSAVSSCVTSELTNRGLQLIEAFDKIPLVSILETMRGLDLFREESLSYYLSIVVRNKLAAILQAARPASKTVRVKSEPKPPRTVTRISAIERKIALGLQLENLKSKTSGIIEFGRLRRKLGVEPVSAQEALRVARLYGQRPEIYRCLTWLALVELSSPGLPLQARTEFESKIIAGDRFTHTQIRARRPLRSGPAQRERLPSRPSCANSIESYVG
jgi:hypothetical protein